MINLIVQSKPRWIGTLFFIPFLYLVGWLLVLPLRFLSISYQNISLIGTILTFVFFMLLLPKWIRIRWKEKQPFQLLGLQRGKVKERPNIFLAISRGIAYAFGLLSLIIIPLLISPWGNFTGLPSFSIIGDSIFLFILVGFAEEIIFRGWLYEELNQYFKSKFSIYLQAIIFSLVHIKFDQDLSSSFRLIVGLFLLGLFLALRRKLDKGSIWGSMGLHGGLVGGWFIVENGLIEISSTTPSWLVGPNYINQNPISSEIAIITLFFLIVYQLTDLARAG